MAVKQKKLIGIEISGNDLRMVLVNSRSKVLQYASSEIPENVLDKEEVLSKTMLAEILRTTGKKMVRSTIKASLTVNSSALVIRYLNIPVMEEKHLMENIKMEIAGLLPDNPDNYVIDYIIDEKITEEDLNQYRVLVFALPMRIIQGYAECVKKAGYKLMYVDVIENAYEKLFRMLKKKGKLNTSNFACINIDNSRVSVTICGDNKFFINKMMDNPMSKVFEELSAKTGVSTEEVKKLLYNEEILTSTTGEFEREKIILEEYIGYIATEINRVVEYYRSRNSGNPLEAAYLTGGFTHIKGIDEYIGNFIGVKAYKTFDYLIPLFRNPPQGNNGVDYTNAIAITLREEGRGRRG